MAKFLTISAVLSSFSASFAFATAVPGTFLPVHPEVIPGPGLPSLASLGITSDDLYKSKAYTRNWLPLDRKWDLIYCIGELVIDSVNGLSKRFDNFCGGGRGATGNVDDVIACFDYLNRLGTTRCGVPGDNNQHIFCTAGTASVNGVSLINRETGSYWYKTNNWQLLFRSFS